MLIMIMKELIELHWSLCDTPNQNYDPWKVTKNLFNINEIYVMKFFILTIWHITWTQSYRDYITEFLIIILPEIVSLKFLGNPWGTTSVANLNKFKRALEIGQIPCISCSSHKYNLLNTSYRVNQIRLVWSDLLMEKGFKESHNIINF